MPLQHAQRTVAYGSVAAHLRADRHGAVAHIAPYILILPARVHEELTLRVPLNSPSHSLFAVFAAQPLAFGKAWMHKHPEGFEFHCAAAQVLADVLQQRLHPLFGHQALARALTETGGGNEHSVFREEEDGLGRGVVQTVDGIVEAGDLSCHQQGGVGLYADVAEHRLVETQQAERRQLRTKRIQHHYSFEIQGVTADPGVAAIDYRALHENPQLLFLDKFQVLTAQDIAGKGIHIS